MIGNSFSIFSVMYMMAPVYYALHDDEANLMMINNHTFTPLDDKEYVKLFGKERCKQ